VTRGGERESSKAARTSVSLGAHSIPTLLPGEAFARAKLKRGDSCASLSLSRSLSRSLARSPLPRCVTLNLAAVAF